MWNELPAEQRNEYKRMILAFASLTEMFAQKADSPSEEDAQQSGTLSPIINSKYQETVFQKVFHASSEDIANTSYDAAIDDKQNNTKYLIGIKTFGIASGDQKVAQFKANHNEWADIISRIKDNAVDENGNPKSREKINEINSGLYMELAQQIAYLRNMRIDSSQSNLQGFSVLVGRDNIQTVYHILMPSKKGDKPRIMVGETSYDKIDIDNLKIIGCSSKNPTNFDFTDGNHTYRFTSADSQLLMNFDNKNIVKDTWDVKYAEDAYQIFADLADRVYGGTSAAEAPLRESHSWKIDAERYSGFNAFYGISYKGGPNAFKKRIEIIADSYKDTVKPQTLNVFVTNLKEYADLPYSSNDEKRHKESKRDDLVKILDFIGDRELTDYVMPMLYRPQDEVYIPIPKARIFHQTYPDFFGPGYGTLIKDGGKWKLANKKRIFPLVLEPSGERMDAYITQDSGKAIESDGKQSILGKWLLRELFQLREHEPLTEKRLNELNINGIRVYKETGKPDIHLEFIWIDDDDLPNDYIG